MSPRSLLTLFAAGLMLVTSPAPCVAAAAKPRTKSSAVARSSEVQQLRELITAQQRQLEDQHSQMDAIRTQLQQLLQNSQQTSGATQKAQESADQAQAVAVKAQQSASQADTMATQASDNAIEAKTAFALARTSGDEQAKRVGALESSLSRFRFTGDVRLRGESFFQDCPQCIGRNRARVRVRLGIEGKLSEDFVGGLALATGSLGDPTTTNESLTNFFDRKTIALDRGFISYQPLAHRWLQLTGGKFAYTWNRTSVTFDQDINPEGFAEKFSFDLKHAAFLKNVNFQVLQLLFNEDRKVADSFAVGGQFGGKLDFGFFTSTPSFTILNWRNTDALLAASAFAVQATTGGSGITTPGEGPGCAPGLGLPSVAPCAIAANGMTNATFLDPVTKKPRFLSRFLYADFILNNQFKTGIARLPFNLLLEYENNLNAADHPLDAKGNPTTLGKQSHAYLVDVSLGQIKNKNDVQFGYAFQRQEQDSIIASFAESDQRAPTNILQNRIYALWKLRQNTVASTSFWIGRTLNSGLANAVLAPGTTAGTQEPYLRRVQFDLIYSF
jgi:predicted component of type VI protein secretion system